MIDLNPDLVCSIIAKAREFHAKEDVVIPEEPDNPGDDWALQVLADHSDDLTYQEVKTAIDELEPDQQIALVALMWVGRGDFDVSEWEAALEEAGDNWTDYTAEYLLSRPLVADYLEEGLIQHGYSCNE